MPDFGSPAVSPTPYNPNAGMQRLSDVLSIQGKQQALQSGALGVQQQQQQLDQGATVLQNAQQQMQERQLLQGAMQSGKDPDGNPIKGGDGEVDPVAMARFANKHLPLIGQGVQQSIIQTLNNRLGLNNAVRDLGQNYRNDVSGIVRSAIGTKQSPQEISAALDAYGKQNPEAMPAISRAQALINSAPATLPQAQRDQALQHLAMEFQPASATAGEQRPSMGTITGPGGGVQPVQYNPNSPFPVGPIGPEMRQGVAPAVGINPTTGQPYTISSTGAGPLAQPGSPQGASTGTTQPSQPQAAQSGQSGSGAPGWPRLSAFPSPQQAQSAMDASKEADAVRAADSSPTAGYNPTKQVYTNLLDLVAKNPAIGPSSKSWNQLTGILTPFGASANSSMQEIDAYLDRLALQNAGAAGLSTDAARHMSQSAAGSTEMSPETLREKLRFGAATLEASHAYRAGLDNVIGTGNDNPIAKRAFDAAWSQNSDIMAFRLLAAKKTNDPDGFFKTMNQIQAMKPEQRALIQQHMTNLNLLAKGQMPQ